MKRLLSLLALVLFTGSLFALEMTATYTFTSKSWAATLGGEAANWTSGQDASSSTSYGVSVTTAVTGANATSPVPYDNISKIVVTYNTLKTAGEGTLEVKVGSNAVKSNAWAYSGEDDGRYAEFTSTFNYATPQSGAVKLTVNTTTNSIYVVSIAITYEYTPASPEIIANKIDLGTIILDAEAVGFAKDTTLAVAGANLSAPIAVGFIGTHLSATEAQLPAAGGTLHLHVASASALALADTVVLTSGETELKVPVVGKIKQNIALPGTAATMTKGLRSDNVTVDGLDGIRVGTSSDAGVMTITVPANTGKIRFYAAGWKDKSVTVSLSAPAEVSITPASLSLVSDAGATGGSPFVLDALTPAAFMQEILLTGVTEETDITLTANTTEKRFIVWDAKYDAGFLVNYLDKAGATLAYDVIILNLPEAPIVSGFTFLYWKAVEGNIAAGINIQAVYQSNTPSESPAVVVNPANPSQKLIREGNVYILHDGREYNLLGTRVR